MSRGVPSSPHLIPRQDDGQAQRALGPDDLVHPREIDCQDLPVQEEQGAQRFVLRGRGDLPLDREGTQEARDFGRPHVGGVALVVEEDVATDPRDIGLLGAAAVMSGADGCADAVEQSWLERAGRVGSPTRSAKASADDSEAVGYEKERLDRRATLAMSWRPPFCSCVLNIAERVESSKANRRNGASLAGRMESDTVEAPAS